VKALLVAALIFGGLFSASRPSRPSDLSCSQQAGSAIREDFWKLAPNGGQVNTRVHEDHGVAWFQTDAHSPPLFWCEYTFACDDAGLHLKRGKCSGSASYLPI